MKACMRRYAFVPAATPVEETEDTQTPVMLNPLSLDPPDDAVANRP